MQLASSSCGRLPASQPCVVQTIRGKRAVSCPAVLCCGVQEGRKRFSAEPTPEDLELFWRKSPIAHVSKVHGPMIFMLGAKDRRVRQGREGQAGVAGWWW